MPSLPLSGSNREIIIGRACDLALNMVQFSTKTHTPRNLLQHIDETALGKLKPHVDALQASRLSYMIQRKVNLRCCVRLWPYDPETEPRNPAVILSLKHDHLGFIAGETDTTTTCMLPDEDIGHMPEIRRWLRQALRTHIEAMIVTQTVHKVLKVCTTTGQLLRYMPNIAKLPAIRSWQDDRADRFGGKEFFAKMDKSYEAGSHLKPELDEWKEVIAVADGIVARAAMLPQLVEEDVRDHIEVFPTVEIALPAARIVPLGLPFPSFEAPPDEPDDLPF